MGWFTDSDDNQDNQNNPKKNNFSVKTSFFDRVTSKICKQDPEDDNIMICKEKITYTDKDGNKKTEEKIEKISNKDRQAFFPEQSLFGIRPGFQNQIQNQSINHEISQDSHQSQQQQDQDGKIKKDEISLHNLGNALEQLDSEISHDFQSFKDFIHDPFKTLFYPQFHEKQEQQDKQNHQRQNNPLGDEFSHLYSQFKNDIFQDLNQAFFPNNNSQQQQQQNINNTYNRYNTNQAFSQQQQQKNYQQDQYQYPNYQKQSQENNDIQSL